MNIEYVLYTLQKLTNSKITQVEIAKALGKTRSDISAKAKRKTELRLSEIQQIESYFNKKYSLRISLIDNTTTNNISQSDDCIEIDLIRACAGSGAIMEEPQKLAISRNEVTRAGHSKIDNLIGVEISGNSMFPTITDGDLLICDKAVDMKSISEKNIYVFRYGERYLCKRILLGLKRVTILSDNADYPKEEIDMADLDTLEIVGRVVMRMSRFL